MVTVIADKEDLPTPVNNGVTAGANGHERPFQYIKDYQEVNFHRSSSCQPLPEDLVDGETKKSSIKGTFFVQIDLIEFPNQLSNHDNNHQPEQTSDDSSLLLTLTDGIITVKAITNDPIPDLNFNVRPGCKLLLTGVIPMKDGILQLTHDNTRFQYGSSTYPRPRSAYRGRGGGSYRPSFEGRRGGGNSNSRYDNDDNESNFSKRPPKTTLMDFLAPLKISNDLKGTIDNENSKPKDRSEPKRRNPEQYHSTTKSNNNLNHTTNHHSDQITFQQDGTNEQLDSEDDPSHSNYRERRNPLPPRLQRAQEERTRRSTGRYYDESVPFTGNELNGNYRNGTATNHSLSSSSSYSRRGDQPSYMFNNASTGQQHPAALSAYPPHANMIATVNGSGQTHLAYFPTNPGALTYSLAGIPSPPFHNQPSSLGPSYPNDHLAFCYGAPYATPTYLPPPVTNGYNGESRHYNNNTASAAQTNSSVDEIETKATNESPPDETNESENKSQSSSASSSNDGNTNSQQVITEQSEGKRRDLNSNPRPRWRVGDMCLARWSEDHEFYVATVVRLHPPSCTVLFRDYNNYDQVYFSDLKILPRDPQYYQYIPPMVASSSDLNALAASVYFPPPPNYYTPTIDGCLMMPEAPPFPFNSAGTFYMCPSTLTSVSRSTCYPPIQQSYRRSENGNYNPNNDATTNSSSPPSKDSNDNSIIDSTNISTDDNQQNLSCSIADAPLSLVTKDEERERSTSTESLTSSRYDEQQQLTAEDEKPDNNSVLTDT